MAHYALLDSNNLVTQVITGRDENEIVNGVTDWEAYYGDVTGQRCVRTSYNTTGNSHSIGGTPFRYNYAGIGFTYDEERDAFIPPKPFESWVLDEDTCLWVAPVPMPDPQRDDFGIATNPTMWDEGVGDWVVVPSE